MINIDLQPLLELWQTLIQKPLFGLALTLAAYQLGLWLYQRCNRLILIHPVLTASVTVCLVLKGLDISYRQYLEGNQLLYFLLGPATVALAVPLHQEFHHLRGLFLPLLITIVLGAAIAATSAMGLAWVMGASESTLLALSPKSVTTPIALGLADRLGALESLTTGGVVATGVVAALMAPLVFKLTGLTDGRMQGTILGLNGHGVGTALAFERAPTTGAFASLAMGLTGALTAFTLPYAIHWWQGF